MNTLYSSEKTKHIMRQAGLELADTSGCTDQGASDFVNQHGYVDSSFRSVTIRPQSIENLRAERRASSFQIQKPPTEQGQTSQASSATMQHNQPRPFLRRTPSGRGVSGENVMALKSPLKEIAEANPLPNTVFDNFGSYTISPKGNYNSNDDARKFINAHGAGLVINYGDRTKGKNNPMSGQSASAIVSSQLKDAEIPLSVDLTGKQFLKLAREIREKS